MKAFIKRLFNFTKINIFIGRLFNYALKQSLEEYPELIIKLRSSNLNYKNSLLLKTLRSEEKGIKLNGDIYISHPLSTILGKNIHIGDKAFFFTKGGLTIGDNTHISRNVSIYTASHQYEGVALPYDQTYIEKSVVIGENVWIGMNVCIVPGINIGEGAIIGMGAVISSDIQPFEIVGNPQQRLLKVRNTIHYKSLKKSNQFSGINGMPISPHRYCELGENLTIKGEKMVFIVGTGRCGSKAIAEILSQHPDIRIKHEPNGQLIKISTQYEHGEISKEDVKLKLLQMYTSCSAPSVHLYGESDQKFSNLMDVIHELYPKAKFVWLVRNPIETINSTYSRGWFDDREFNYPYRPEINVKNIYSGTIYSENRINGSKCGCFKEEEWTSISPFERNCWYWFYWNYKIQKSITENKNLDYFKLDINKLDTQLKELINFLNVTPLKINTFKSNSASYNIISESDWSKEQMKIFKKWSASFPIIL